jgi:hypothetical protein
MLSGVHLTADLLAEKAVIRLSGWRLRWIWLVYSPTAVSQGCEIIPARSSMSGARLCRFMTGIACRCAGCVVCCEFSVMDAGPLFSLVSVPRYPGSVLHPDEPSILHAKTSRCTDRHRTTCTEHQDHSTLGWMGAVNHPLASY